MGRRTVKVVPSSTLDSTSMRPPCLVTVLYDSDRPSPVPLPTGLVVKKGSKMRFRFSGGMPLPMVMTPRSWIAWAAERTDHLDGRTVLVADQAQLVVHPQVVAAGGAEPVFVGPLALDEQQGQAGEDTRRVFRVDVVEPEVGIGQHLSRLVAEDAAGILAEKGQFEVAGGHRTVDNRRGIVDQVLQADRGDVCSTGRGGGLESKDSNSSNIMAIAASAGGCD